MSSTIPTAGSPASPAADRRGASPLGAWPAGQPRAALVAHVADALADLPAGAPVVVGASGGPDSAALLRLVRDARPDLAVLACHVRHGLRDDSGDRDAARAQAHAAGLEFRESAVTVVERGEGLAAAARAARLDALARVAREGPAAAVLLAHTADDRAETVLLNLARGSGLSGLAATAPSRAHAGVQLRRPLLALRRVDVRRVAADGPPPVTDPSNDDRQRRRTLARRDALPALAALSGGDGDPVATLTRLADLARDDDAVLTRMADDVAAGARRDWGPVRAVRADVVDAEPPALARRVLRGMLAAADGRAPDAAAVETARTLPPGSAATVQGGVRVAHHGGWRLAVPRGPLALRSVEVEAPGAANLPGLDLLLRVGPARPGTGGAAPAGPPAAHPLPPMAGEAPPPLPPMAGQASPPLVVAGPRVTVRPRRPGDRLLRHGRQRSVTETLADAGVPGMVRDLVPVVVDADGRVAGLPGVAAADPPERSRWRVWLEPARPPAARGL